LIQIDLTHLDLPVFGGLGGGPEFRKFLVANFFLLAYLNAVAFFGAVALLAAGFFAAAVAFFGAVALLAAGFFAAAVVFFGAARFTAFFLASAAIFTLKRDLKTALCFLVFSSFPLFSSRTSSVNL
jgi:hypothetical protein